MDYIITNQIKLLTALLEILGRHQDERHVGEAFAYLKDAKSNYQQRSIDHMMRCLVLVIDELLVGKLSEGLQAELEAKIHQYVSDALKAGATLGQLASQYEASGGKLLSRDEILQEVNERRGSSL